MGRGAIISDKHCGRRHVTVTACMREISHISLRMKWNGLAPDVVRHFCCNKLSHLSLWLLLFDPRGL